MVVLVDKSQLNKVTKNIDKDSFIENGIVTMMTSSHDEIFFLNNNYHKNN